MCGSLDTKRNGKTSSAPVGLSGRAKRLQRFWCLQGGHGFTAARRRAPLDARYGNDVVLEAARLYIEGLASYRTLARLLGGRVDPAPSPITLNRWVVAVAEAAKTPLEVSAELAPPNWGGFLVADGKAIKVRGREHVLLLGVDSPSQDVVHALVVPSEKGEVLAQLVTEAVTEAAYPLKGLVTDLAPGFRRAAADYFGDLPHQACRVHADRRLDQYIRKAKRDRAAAAVAADLKTRIRAILYAPTLDQASELFHQLLADRDRYAQVGRRLHPTTRPYDPIAALEHTFDLHMTHHLVPGMPADNNVVENVIKQLGKKPRLMEGFATVEHAERYTRLLIACYRFKPFTDSNNGHNGHTPLQLAGAQPPTNNWLKYLLNHP